MTNVTQQSQNSFLLSLLEDAASVDDDTKKAARNKTEINLLVRNKMNENFYTLNVSPYHRFNEFVFLEIAKPTD